MKSVLSCTVVALCLASTTSLTSIARAQANLVTFVTSDRTIANGNPINSSLPAPIIVGQDSAGNLVPGVDLDVVTGTSLGSLSYLYARSDSRVTVFDGEIGGGFIVDGTAQIRVVTANFGGIRALDNGSLTIEGGRGDTVQVSNNATVRITGGLFASRTTFTLLESQNANSLLELLGGTTTGAVRVGGGGLTRVSGGNYGMLHSLTGVIEVSGGLPETGARLVALNRGAGNQGRFTFIGTGFTLTNPVAGSYFDPTYLISQPGVFYNLRGTLADGRTINASYFEEGLTVAEMPRLLTFASSAAPEPGTLVLLSLALLPLCHLVRPRQRKKLMN